MEGYPFRILAILFLAASVAQAQFTCTTNNDNTAVITGYSGPGGALTVPGSMNGTPITSIADAVFYVRPDITSLTIADSITNFGKYTFYNCAGVTNVAMPAGLVSIGDYAFSGCSNLSNVVLPGGVTTVGTGAFSYCSRLAGITLSTNLTNIGYTEFLNCSNLTNVNIPTSVTSIGEYAFSGCTRLANVIIPFGVTNFDYGAFFKCSSLSNIIIPASVTSVGQYAFFNCTNLAVVRFNGNFPNADFTVFSGDNAHAYYIPGALGWSSTVGGIPASFWTLPNPVILDNDGLFGVQSNQFGFTVAWATNVSFVVSASVDLATWQVVQTNTTMNGSYYFTDPVWSYFTGRFYRVAPVTP
jgi:hypothetical protein